MRYMILIHGDEAVWDSLSPDDAAKGMAEYMAYSKALRDAGKPEIDWQIPDI